MSNSVDRGMVRAYRDGKDEDTILDGSMKKSGTIESYLEEMIAKIEQLTAFGVQMGKTDKVVCESGNV